MTSAAVDHRLYLPEPLGLQPKWLSSPASRKLLRVGRRGTKTRFAFNSAEMNGSTFSGLPIFRRIFITASFAPPWRGPLSVPMAEVMAE